MRGSNLWKYIVDKMTIDNWSPPQIAGRMKIDWDNLHKPGCSEPLEYAVSHETIYEWIYSLASNKDSKDNNDNKDKKHDPYYESDLHILTRVDRRSGYLLADKLDRATALETQLKIISRFRLLPDNKKHTITYDNGAQFSLHQGTEQKVRNTYFLRLSISQLGTRNQRKH